MKALSRYLPVTVLLLAAIVMAPSARADMMLGGSTNMVYGTQTYTTSFMAPSSGTVTVSLSNIDWPERLASLSASAGDATSILASKDQIADTDFITFTVGGPGTYYTHVTAVAGTLESGLNLGLFSMKVNFTPSAVPLPASVWLLIGGVGVFFGMRGMRRRSDEEFLPLAAAA